MLTRYERKGTSEALSLGKAKSATDTVSAHSPIKYRTRETCFAAHSSAKTVEYETTQQRPTHMPLVTEHHSQVPLL